MRRRIALLEREEVKERREKKHIGLDLTQYWRIKFRRALDISETLEIDITVRKHKT